MDTWGKQSPGLGDTAGDTVPALLLLLQRLTDLSWGHSRAAAGAGQQSSDPPPGTCHHPARSRTRQRWSLWQRAGSQPLARAREVAPTEEPSFPTCHQPLHLDGSFQLDPLQLILQDQLIGGVDVLGQGWLRHQVVLGWDRAGCDGFGKAKLPQRAFPPPAKPRSWKPECGRVTHKSRRHGPPPPAQQRLHCRFEGSTLEALAALSAPHQLHATRTSWFHLTLPRSAPAKQTRAQLLGQGGSGSARQWETALWLALGNVFAITTRASALLPLNPARQAWC